MAQLKIQGNQILGSSLIDVQVFTLSGSPLTGSPVFGSPISSGGFTWIKPAGTGFVEVYVIGAGGGGGGVVPDAGRIILGGGGGGGGSGYAIISTGLGSTELITVGIGGDVVVGNDGNPGGSSSFGSFVISEGGKGGNGPPTPGVAAQGGLVSFLGVDSSIGITGGTGDTFCDLNPTGDWVVTNARGGMPGFGFGIQGHVSHIHIAGVLSGSSFPPRGYGVGGSGALANNVSGSNASGGVGLDGIVIVKSYS